MKEPTAIHSTRSNMRWVTLHLMQFDLIVLILLLLSIALFDRAFIDGRI